MAQDLGLYLNSINTTKKNVMRGIEAEVDPKIISDYPDFIIHRLLSYHPDCVLLVNELNKMPHLDPQLKYEFLLHALPKGRRFSKLHKAPQPERLVLVKKFYGYSTAKALEVLDIHTEEDFAQMEKALSEGGILREKTSKRTSRSSADKA